MCPAPSNSYGDTEYILSIYALKHWSLDLGSQVIMVCILEFNNLEGKFKINYLSIL